MKEKQISRHVVISNMIWRFGERILAQVATFVVSVVLARKLDTSDFGNVALLMVFIDIANVFVVQSFSSALVQKKDVDNTDYSSVFFFSLFFSFLVYGVLFFASPLTAYAGNHDLSSLLRVLALRIPLAAVNSVQHAYAQKNLLFRKYFWKTLIGTVISAFVGIYMAYSGYGAWALVGQYLSNSICDTIMLWLFIGWRPQKIFDLKRLKQLIGFGWKMLCSALVHVIYNRLTSFCIGSVYTTTDLAFYEQGHKIPGIIETNVDSTINTVLFPVMSEQQDNYNTIKGMIRKSIQTSGSIIWPMMMGLAVLSDQLIDLIYGEKWLPATIFMIIACFKLTLEPIQTANLQAIKAVGRSDIYLKMEIIKKVFGILVIAVGVQISVLATAVAAVAQTVFSSLVNGYVNKKIFSYQYKEQISDIMLSCILSIIMAAIVLGIRKLCVMTNYLQLIVEIVTGMCVYSFLLYVSNRKQFLFLLSMIRRQRNKGQ